ncbi:MAG: 3-isopropylmalate dehydratase large subunit [bacterium]
MTITEKILAAHTGRDEVRAGELIMADIDLVMANELSAIVAIKEFEKVGAQRVFDPERIALVPDHFTPNKDMKTADITAEVRQFAEKHGIVHYFEVGRGGIEHVLLPEEGLVAPGELIIGGDSHTCTYGALGAFATGVGSTDVAAAFALGQVWLRVPRSIRLLYRGRPRKWVCGKDVILYTIGDLGVDGAIYQVLEFTGDGVAHLTLADRFTMANMAVEAGAKTGIFEPDETAVEYIKQRIENHELRIKNYKSDPEGEYVRTVEYDLSEIEPQVAFPPLPDNVRPVTDAGEVPIDQVAIGFCTNGRIEDLRIAAQVLKGKKVHPRVRALIFPGTQRVALQAIREGLVETFIESGCAVSTPSCGPCIGGHLGVLGEGERCLATTNRNFVGRMGHPSSEIYLASPAVAAASAVTGTITHPEEVT